MVKKAFQNPEGGLNQKGRDHFKKKEGSNLKPPVKKTPPKGTAEFKRKVSFAARFAGMKGPMKEDQGRPTRKALALRAWGFRNEESARNFANKHKAKV